ncbi:FtsW/RodA/SpoVE family cell cycle protein [Candidatus Saccharibacteria bacterium]|nr:MAG: FtsW/RodA/SpoVE family cell cycle protein [Candidatus Saccharibacteria bacterium]
MERARRQAGRVSTKVSEGLQRRHRPDYQIVLFMGLLMLLGLILMYAIGPQRANVLNKVHNTDFYTDTYFVVKQAVSLTAAIAAFVVLSKVPFAVIKRYAMKLMQIGLGLVALLFVAGNLLHIDAIATNTLGAYRWFNLGPLGGFQPAEVLKIALLIYLAVFLSKRSSEGAINNIERTVLPVVGITGLILFIVVVLQKDMGTGIAFSSIVGAMLTMSGMSWKLLLQMLAIAMMIGVLLIVFVPHRRERLTTFLMGDKATDSSHAAADDSNYHIKNAMIALGTGGLVGLGIGNSIQATGYLPEAINDSVFAIMGEIFGFVGVTVILGLFGALLLRILRIADRLTDMTMKLAVAGVFGWLAAHVVLNVASMIGLVPLTGITLPLLSFGGTSMVFVAGALGLVYQLSQFTSHSTIMEPRYENSSSRRRIGGSRHPSRRGFTRA